MKHPYIYLLCLFVSLLTTSTPAFNQVSKVMTYNIRYDNHDDGINKWDERKSAVLDLIKYYEPEVLGLQEALLHQLEFLESNLTQYSRIGVGREDGKEQGEYSPILYDSRKLQLIESSTFWLSDSDHIVSVGWDAALERICTYGVFENKKSKRRIVVLNTHYDHKGKLARTKSSELIIDKIREINTPGYPVILMGDFNALSDSAAINTLKTSLDDAGSLTVDGIYGPLGTFTGFKKNNIAERRIDYIFVSGLNVKKYRHIDDKTKGGNYLSDHLPVLIEIDGI